MATHVDIVADFDNRSVMVSANDLKRDVERAGDDAGRAYGQGFTRAADGRIRDERGRFVKVGQDLGGDLAKGMGDGLNRNLSSFKIGLSGAIDATRGFHDEQKRLQDLMRNGAAWELVVQQSEKVARSHDFARFAARQAGDAFKEFDTVAKGLASTSGSATGALGELGGSLGRLGSAGPAGAAALAVVGIAAVELGGAAASAAQSLALIPAAAGAAGAAIGTVALATYGFGDALKAVGDPQKFGEALKQLSPNAQQAALSISSLMPVFKQLQRATQDAFFANVGPQLTQLTNQLLPTIQSMTTGIATAMNQMFSGVAQQLMTPETQAAIQTFTTNVVSAFQALAPAVAPLTKAFAEITAVGSGFLPELGRAATDAAQRFSAFITEASRSGQLKQFIGDGLESLKQLGSIAITVGKAFMELAPVGRVVLPEIAAALKPLPAMVEAITPVVTTLGIHVTIVSKAFDGITNAVSGMYDRVKPILENFRELILGAMGPLGVIIDQAQKLGVLSPGDSGRGGGIGGAGTTVSKDAARRDGMPDGGLFSLPSTSWFPGQQQPGTWGGPAAPRTPNADGTWGTKGSAASLPTAPVTPYNTSLPAGFEGLPQTPALYSAQSSYMDANTDLANKQARLDQLQKSNVAKAEDIQKARNDVVEAERNQHEAELRLYSARDEALQKNTKQLNSYADQMGEIGAKLDQDLGISKGLPGIAENLVRFLGSLAAAPLEAQLQAISNAPGQAQGGFGLMGILGAQGAFGPQYTAAGQAAASASASALGPAALQPTGSSYAPGPQMAGDYGLPAGTNTGGYGTGTSSTFPAWVMQMADAFGIKPSTYSGHQESDRHEAGYAPNPNHENRGIDWSGPVANMQRFADYLSTVPGSLEQVIWKNPNTGQTDTIAGGRPVSGYYDAGTLAEHQNHVHTRQSAPIPLPAGGGAMPAAAYDGTAPTGVATAAPLGSGLPVPLPVTIVGGGGGGWATGGPAGGVGAPGSSDPYAPSSTGPVPGPSIPSAPGASAPATPFGWGNTGIPAGISGGAGQGPVFGANPMGPGAGAAAGTQIGAAVDPPSGSGKGGVGMDPGGPLGTALSVAASGLDVMAPGAGQAAQIGIKLANRAIQYGGQAAGIGVQGLFDTFLPTGGSKLAGGSWLTKIAGGIAGAAPALPNMAGKGAPPKPDQQGQNGQGQQPMKGGDTNITVQSDPNRGADGTGRDIAYHAQAAALPPAMP